MTCAEFEELSGAYVLDALTPEEKQQAEKHLATCVDCTRTVQELSEIVSLLPLAVPQVEPSSDVKRRVLTEIAGNIQPLQIIQGERTMARPPRRRAQWNMGIGQLVAVAALLLIVLGGLVGWNITLQQQLAHVTAGVPVTYLIEGTTPSTTISGQLTYLPQQHLTIMVLHGLPQLQGSHLYQGWLLKGKQPTSVGVLSEQNGVATLDFTGDVNQYDAAAVSLEPGPTASLHAPAGPVVALGTFSKPGA